MLTFIRRTDAASSVEETRSHHFLSDHSSHFLSVHLTHFIFQHLLPASMLIFPPSSPLLLFTWALTFGVLAVHSMIRAHVADSGRSVWLICWILPRRCQHAYDVIECTPVIFALDSQHVRTVFMRSFWYHYDGTLDILTQTRGELKEHRDALEGLNAERFGKVSFRSKNRLDDKW